jgi:HrpA-like RNA helicase
MFVEQAVEVAINIHKNEPPGDVLVFLTSPVDLTAAVESFRARNVPNVVVFELHGRLQVEDQMKIFEPAPRGMRKVVFGE